MAFCLTTVSNDRVAVVEQFGKYKRTLKPGLNVVCCCIGECVAGDVTTRVTQLNVIAETKTKDNVFVHATVAVQYVVDQNNLLDAFYKLTDPKAQITTYVYDVVRSSLPRIKLDDVFDSKDEIADAILDELTKAMPQFGYNIVKVLLTDISPNEKVKAAMNQINAATRLRQAAHEKAEAEKIIVVKAAEADAESKYLQGVGISRQRQAIVGGLQESVASFADNVDDIAPKDVLQLMLMTQYFDMMKDVGASSNSNVVFVPHSPSAVADVGEQVRNGLMQAQAMRQDQGVPPAQKMVRKRQSLANGLGLTEPY